DDWRGEVIANVDDGRGLEGVIDHDPFGVKVARLNHDCAARTHDRRIRAVVAHDPDFTEVVGRTHDYRIVHLHEHGFETFVEVDAIFVRVEWAGFYIATRIVGDDGVRRNAPARADDGRCWQRVPDGEDLNARIGDL